ncbi:unnamed protein product [Phytophthora lilii]|uniref:Unnamed protein product n=1 Tax=Phytophthora lilii TaxID=2077276 RepID=A0A9W6TH66_9STRA|nr:unnamed protein product [Phytophthora lilii]
MKDDRLEGVALEGYFHAVVRGGQPLLIDYCTYDNVSRKNIKEAEWRAIMDKDKGEISFPPASKIKWSGADVDDCVEVMKRWSVDLSMANYWIPADSLCETIDAVAKCKFRNENESRICFLQLTKAKKHKFDADILWRLAQPFVGKVKVCYIALMSVKDHDIVADFRLMPAVISHEEISKHIPLYVARYRFASVESTFEESQIQAFSN